MEKGIITIGRQYGSQGKAVGKKLAQRLGCAFYDKDELARIARGRDYEEVREFYEEQPVDSLLYAIAMNNEEGEVGSGKDTFCPYPGIVRQWPLCTHWPVR